MPYKVYKLRDDKRNHTCGFTIPNGGFYYVIEMTFENHKRLSDISKRPCYSVDKVEGREGFFDKDGYEVKEDSLVINKISKVVESYEKKTRQYRGKAVSKKESHEGVERREIEEAAQRRGIRNAEWLSTQSMKQAVERSSKRPQGSLAVG